jgi:hypothetical protein
LVRNLFVIFASFCWILRISERILTEDSEGNKGWNWLGTPSLSSLPSVGFFAFQREFLQKAAKGNKGWNWLGTPSLSSLPSVGFFAFQREFLQKAAKATKIF